MGKAVLLELQSCEATLDLPGKMLTPGFPTHGERLSVSVNLRRDAPSMRGIKDERSP
jgi:hypothetical protein